jgi:hypothetical protein
MRFRRPRLSRQNRKERSNNSYRSAYCTIFHLLLLALFLPPPEVTAVLASSTRERKREEDVETHNTPSLPPSARNPGCPYTARSQAYWIPAREE